MKKFISLTASLILLGALSQTAFAQETVNPGEDPNLAITASGDGTQAGVVGTGLCPICELKNAFAGRLGDNTNPGAKSSSGSGKSSSQDGTR